MKKNITEAQVQRMRNIVTKQYGNKTHVRSGYTTSHITRQEGDTWAERGKEWTIRNGIKRTVTKLDKARSHSAVPLACPKCAGKMTHAAHKHTYHRWGICFICTTKWEREMHADNTYDAFIKKIDDDNFDVWVNDVTTEYHEWLSAREASSFVTEAGVIEEWTGGKTTEELKLEFDTQIDLLKEQRNEAK
jgi:hypothetical protein|tara:strand:- start:528 stop:1097 length:570 start_codon:yes stop_codon:yes gene_type:complete